mmetsp:Transcript_85634/g.215755  ORF Transcript_85634/g.215755 Transcript_85634/m.215755 type:complete len:164 (-) Transcript_85634:345-836(-)
MSPAPTCGHIGASAALPCLLFLAVGRTTLAELQDQQQQQQHTQAIEKLPLRGGSPNTTHAFDTPSQKGVDDWLVRSNETPSANISATMSTQVDPPQTGSYCACVRVGSPREQICGGHYASLMLCDRNCAVACHGQGLSMAACCGIEAVWSMQRSGVHWVPCRS